MMNSINIKIWNREFDLPVNYDCFDDEEISEIQKLSVQKLEENTKIIDDSLDELISYIKKDSEKLKDVEIVNIFKYVIPTKIYVGRDENKRIISLFCDYKYDEENGIAIMFEDEELREIGKQDIAF